MSDKRLAEELFELEQCQSGSGAGLDLSRRGFVQLLGAGLVITVSHGQAGSLGVNFQPGKRGTIGSRLHIGQDGIITVMTGKVEVGQGSRAQITQAAAEELRVSVDRIRLIMADTDLVPDDGTTAGSRTTPSTVPAVRRTAATARQVLTDMACRRWNVSDKDIELQEGTITHKTTKRSVTYGELAKSTDFDKVYEHSDDGNATVTSVSEWQVLGVSVPRPNRRDIVAGAHRFPSDIQRPEMLYGKILRPPGFGASLVSIDISEAKAMKNVVVVHDGDFIGCAASNSFSAAKAVKAISKTATWDVPDQPSGKELFSYLKDHAQIDQGRGGRRGRSSGKSKGSVEYGLKSAKRVLSETYEVAYIQHAPMEPRAAVAQWENGKLTVWTGTQAPNRVQSDLADFFGIDSKLVRVIVPDTGGGFGGKHTGDAAVEAARLARVADKPVSLRWSREEEFTWAYFRPAALIEIQAGLDGNGSLIAWDFKEINAGSSGINSPYEIPNARTRYLRSDPPLRQGSYRCLAATANNFARESFMDELAAIAGTDPLAFRLSHLKDTRLRAVLEAAAKKFRWDKRKGKTPADTGVGLACGTEKDSFVACCAEVSVDRNRGTITVRNVCEAFECGAVQNPDNLRAQVQGCIIMGLGAALREEIRFEKGRILNAGFAGYQVPRFQDVPDIDVVLLDRQDLPSVGGGETPIIGIAPAIANAVFDATGIRIRSMPLSASVLKKAGK